MGCDWNMCHNLGFVLKESTTDEADCCWRVASGRKAAGAIRSLGNAWGL